jgi:hypothetical protein
MRILVIERDIPGVESRRMRPLLKAEASAVWALTKQDVLRDIWFTPDHRAVLMLECADEASAREVLRSLPLYREGLIDFEITELFPYDGLERLFTEKA